MTFLQAAWRIVFVGRGCESHAADLCFVTTCMGRLASLRQTLGADARPARQLVRGRRLLVSRRRRRLGRGEPPVGPRRPRAGPEPWSHLPRPATPVRGTPTPPGSASSIPTSSSTRASAPALLPTAHARGLLPRLVDRPRDSVARSPAPGPTSSGSAAMTRFIRAGARRTTTCTTHSSSSGVEPRPLPEPLPRHLPHGDDRAHAVLTHRRPSTGPCDQPRLPHREVGHRPAQPRASDPRHAARPLRQDRRGRDRFDPDRPARRPGRPPPARNRPRRLVALAAAHLPLTKDT